ncbi:Uncharacterised protein [Serratia marcescens]|nr:hypothetical protein [Serratia marcescens]CUZ12846.1 Uncharacterised protein [Serratia marcescens]CUZ59427.1 Uncharacterised protein [Serratia marcescens]CVB76059.1 Uncharacterised protein [Serratia marcescens]CVC58057.1 Uncharacterised protein [Serratia marcescens]
MKRFTPDCSIHMSHEMAFMRETPDGAYMEYQDHLAVKTQRDNLAARVSELELVLQGLSQAAIDGGWTAKGISEYASKLEKQVKELNVSETNLIQERDEAEVALADMYEAATGRRPEWSNWFGFTEAIDEVAEIAAGWGRGEDE